MTEERRLSEKVLDEAYRVFMPQEEDRAVEAASNQVYSMIRGYMDFLNLEEVIKGYSAATERRGFHEGFQAGLLIAISFITREQAGAMKGEVQDKQDKH